MKTLITNPPWATPERVGFRSNVRWPFTVSRADWEARGRPGYHFPIYQAYAAALFQRSGLPVGVVDCSIDAVDAPGYLARIERESPDIIVIEVATASFAGDIDHVRRVKERFGKPIVLIGPHSTIFHDALMREHRCVDFIARGEYEYTLLDLVKTLAAGGSPEGVPGITYRAGGQVRVNPPRPFIENLDELPFPARDLFAWERYHEPDYLAAPWITMITSRGCPYRCTFCLWPQAMYGHRFRARSARNVVDEMEYCVARYTPAELFFDDDTFTLGKQRVLDLCDEIIRRGVTVVWSCMGRVDTVDEEMLSRMHRAGCRKIKFGVETGSAAIMQAIRKGINLAEVPKAFETAKRCGLEVHGTFMIGLPGETRETVYETIRLAQKLPNDFLQFSIATPLPGTEFFALCETKNWLVTSDWAHFDGNYGAVMSYPTLSREEMEELRYFAIISCPPRSAKVATTPAAKFFDELRARGPYAAFARAMRYLMRRTGLLRRDASELVLRGPVRPGLGWHLDENPLGAPGIGREAFLLVEPHGSPMDISLTLVARAPVAPPPFPVLTASVNGAPAGSWRLGPEWSSCSFTVRVPCTSGEVTLTVDRAHRVCPPGKVPRFFGALIREVSARATPCWGQTSRGCPIIHSI
jgi:radical SAM superfamily enzyme YgiQ (UPF0313 family)